MFDQMSKQFTIDSLKIEIFMKEFELKTLLPKDSHFSRRQELAQLSSLSWTSSKPWRPLEHPKAIPVSFGTV